MHLQRDSCSQASAQNRICSLQSRRDADRDARHASAALSLFIESRLRQETSCLPAESDFSVLGAFSDSDLTSSLSTSTRRSSPSMLYPDDNEYDDEVLALARQLHRAVLSLDRRTQRETSPAEPHEEDPRTSNNKSQRECPISLSFGSLSLDEMLEMDQRTTNDGSSDDELSHDDSTVDSLVYYKIRALKASKTKAV